MPAHPLSTALAEQAERLNALAHQAAAHSLPLTRITEAGR